MIKEILNEQELLDVCLSLVALEQEPDEYFAGPAGKLITYYACSELVKEKERLGEEPEFSDEEVAVRVNQLIVGKVLEQMTKKNLIQTDFSGDEVMYGLTEESIDYLNKLKKNK